MPAPQTLSISSGFLFIACVFLTSPASAQTTATVQVTAGTALATIPSPGFGINTAVWDGVFADSQTLATLQGMDARFLRFPGGSSSDDFNWQTNQAVIEGGKDAKAGGYHGGLEGVGRRPSGGFDQR